MGLVFNLTFLLVDFGKELWSFANKLQQNSNAPSRIIYSPNIDYFVIDSLRLYFVYHS